MTIKATKAQTKGLELCAHGQKIVLEKKEVNVGKMEYPNVALLMSLTLMVTILMLDNR